MAEAGLERWWRKIRILLVVDSPYFAAAVDQYTPFLRVGMWIGWKDCGTGRGFSKWQRSSPLRAETGLETWLIMTELRGNRLSLLYAAAL